MKISVSIVNYRSWGYLKGCLKSLENELGEINGEVVIANNDVEPIKELIIKTKYRFPVEVIEIGENIGFGRAHNRNAKQANGEFIFFLNPDCELPAGSISTLLNTLENSSQEAIIAPLLIDKNDCAQPVCFGEEISPISTLLGKIFTRRSCSYESIKNENFPVDWVSGGAMLIKRRFFEKIGGFDENIFMYFEDVDFCRRARSMGFQVLLCPAVRIKHFCGKSSESHSHKKKLYYASQDYYFKKYYGRAACWAVKIISLPVRIFNIHFHGS